MQEKLASRRLQQVQRILDSDRHEIVPTSNRHVLVLPDNLDVCVSEPIDNGSSIISIDSRDIFAYRHLGRTAALVLSALGTPFERENPVPRYPVLALSTVTQGEAVSAANLWACVYALWTLFHGQENIPITFSQTVPNADEFTSFLLDSGLARRALDASEGGLFLMRGTFWQGAGMGPVWGNARGWLRYTPDYNPFPHAQSFTRSANVIAQHPLRPPKPPRGTTVYRRYCADIGRVFTFHVLNPEDPEDMEGFHRWMNDERVNSAWGERGDLDKHREYVYKALDDASVLPLIMSWDGERMGYCEMVWIKENHLAPYVPSGARDYDRGMHVLVGEDKFRGPAYSRVWFRTILHYIFLSDARTERMIGEPKSSNRVAIQLGRDCGMHHETTFYFPYKQSSMEVCLRERFFKADMLL